MSAENERRRLFALLGDLPPRVRVPHDAWHQRVFPAGHVETPAMREAVVEFLQRCFGRPSPA